jgi:hypothetical protein
MELSLPTVRGNTACGNKTVSRTGRTAIRRTLEISFPERVLGEGEMKGWFDIECPRISLSSLDAANPEELQKNFYFPPSLLLPHTWQTFLRYGPVLDAVPLQEIARKEQKQPPETHLRMYCNWRNVSAIARGM